MPRPIVIMGGYLSSPDDYLAMAHTLAAPPFGRVVYITDFGRAAWAGLRDPDFAPALDALAATVELALRETGTDAVELIGHSAGGRIARAYLGETPYRGATCNGQRFVARLITLGTAHTTYEIWVREFAASIEQQYPGAFYSHVSYRSVAGESVRGRRLGSLEEIVAYRSYAVSYGDGNQVGDGIVPTRACFLPGADNLVLEGARHTPYTAPRSWYGAGGVVPLWYDNAPAI